MKSRNKFLIALSLVLGGGLLGCNKLNKSAYIERANVLKLEVDNEISSVDEELSSTIEEENSTVEEGGFLYVDENSNGIPDELENYFDNTDFSIKTGVTLSALVGSLFALLTFIFSVFKQDGLSKDVKKITEANTKVITDYKEAFNGKTREIIDLTESTISSFKEHIDKMEDLKKAFAVLKNENSDLSKAISKFTSENEEYKHALDILTEKIAVIIKNQELMSLTNENLQSGVAQQVKANIEGAVDYGREE